MSTATIIITGVNGFVGEHLARYLKSEGHTTIGVGRDAAAGEKVASLLDSYVSADLLDKGSTKNISFKGVDAVIHLAGLASVAESFKNPELFVEGNAAMTDNLLSVAVEQGFTGRAVIISTGAVYNSDQPSPFSEEATIGGSSPYATGKIKAEQVALSYADKGISVVIARPFNHIGPGQGPGFFIPDMYEQLKKGESSITAGDLTNRRDYTDVRDIVKAYAALALADTLQSDIYNVASGSSKTSEEILITLENAAGLHNIEHILDPARLRPNDPKDITGDASRIKNELGWAPTIPLSQTIEDIVSTLVDTNH